jgi:hypothetical protein
MRVIEELSNKYFHDPKHEESVITDLARSKSVPALFRICDTIDYLNQQLWLSINLLFHQCPTVDIYISAR